MSKTRKLTVCGLLIAVVVVLQLLSYVVKIGTFNLCLVLVPIIFGAYLYGPAVGALLGAAFGAVVSIASATGLDAGAVIMFQANPFFTVLVCMLKGTAAGFCAGLVAKLLKNTNEYAAMFLSAITAPVVNTGIFCIAMFTGFKDLLYQWAGGTNAVTYLLLTLVGVNFLVELTVNIVLAPSVLIAAKAVRKI